MEITPPEKATPRELLQEYYVQHGFDADGGYSSPVVAIKFGRFFKLYLPNFDARRLAIRKHDLHHLITEYTPSTILGESEIGTWEIAAGTKNYWAALVLDASAIMLGFLMSPSSIFNAFVRGRRTKSLYYDIITDDEALDRSLGELRGILDLDEYGKRCDKRFSDYPLFAGFILLAFLYSVIVIITSPFFLIFSLIYSIKVRSVKPLGQE